MKMKQEVKDLIYETEDLSDALNYVFEIKHDPIEEVIQELVTQRLGNTEP